MKELKWGETPWDGLSREELLREVQRMYAALVSLNSALRLCQRDETGGFWSVPGDGRSSTGQGGTGGRALEKARLILEPLYTEFESEDIFRSFFRYACDLLFTPELGYGWTACDGCKHLYGDNGASNPLLGKPCQDCAREGRHFIRRRLEWRDLAR